MALAELEELKEKIQELLDKGIIRSSISPEVVPLIFVKEDRSL